MENKTTKTETPQNQPQTISDEDTNQQPPQRERMEYQGVTHKRKLMKKRGKSACYDLGASVHAMKPGDYYIPTYIPSDKVFEIPDGKNLYG